MTRRGSGAEISLNRNCGGGVYMSMLEDLRFAVRMMRRHRASTLVALATPTASVGAANSMFSLFEATVLRELPYRQPSRLCMLWTREARSRRGMNSTFFDFRDWREQARSFEHVAAFRSNSFNIAGARGPEQVSGLESTPELLDTLGVAPEIGRSFLAIDDDVVLISHALWVRQYGGDRGIVGRVVRVDGAPRTVIGVLPAGFYFPPVRFRGQTDILVPHRPRLDRTGHYLQVVARLKNGVARADARTDMDRIAANLDHLHTERGETVLVDPIGQYTTTFVRDLPLLLLGAVAFLVLIACANVAHLLLFQASARRSEMAVRLAIGASRTRLVRQLLTESLLLSGSGTGLGLVLAWWALPLLAMMAPASSAVFMRLQDTGLQLNPTVLLFAVSVSVIVGVMFGTLPAYRSTRPMQDLARGRRRGVVRAAMLMGEVAMSFVLVAGAGLMTRSVARLTSVDPGFRSAHLLTAATDLPLAKYSDADATREFVRRVAERIGAVPDVVSVAAASDLPLTGAAPRTSFTIEDRPGVEAVAPSHSVTPGYFETMGIPLVAGRLLDEGDRADQGQRVAVVSRTLAARYWPRENPVGHTIIVARARADMAPKGRGVQLEPERIEIVGVVGDVRTAGLDLAPRADLYLPFGQRPSNSFALIVKTTASPGALAAAIPNAVWSMDPDQPVTDVKTMDEWVSDDIAPRRFVLLLIAGRGAIALILALAGIYGVVSFSVAERGHELAVRLALGARTSDVVWSVVRGSVGWLGAGGLIGAVTLGRLLSSYLFEVQPTDIRTLLVVSAVLVLGGLAANVSPIRRALRIEPARALRHE
jgi:putative ABC transport system permease protein